MEVLFDKVFKDPAPYVDEVQKINVPTLLSSQYERPPTEEVICVYSNCSGTLTQLPLNCVTSKAVAFVDPLLALVWLQFHPAPFC